MNGLNAYWLTFQHVEKPGEFLEFWEADFVWELRNLGLKGRNIFSWEYLMLNFPGQSGRVVKQLWRFSQTQQESDSRDRNDVVVGCKKLQCIQKYPPELSDGRCIYNYE